MKQILPLFMLPSLCGALLANAPPAPKPVDPQKVKVTASVVVGVKSSAARAAIAKPGVLGRLAFNAVQADDVKAFVQLSVHGLSEKDTGLLLNSVVDQSLGLIKKDMAIRIELLGKIPEDKLKPNAKRALAEARQFLEDPVEFKAKVLKEELARVEEKRIAVRVGFARLRATLAKRGIDLKQAKFLKVDASDVRPALTGGGAPFESGDLDVVFTHKNRRYTLTIGNCANPPGFGWLAVDAPHFRDPSDPNDVASRPKLPTTLPGRKPTAGEGGSDGYDENWSTDLDAALAQAAKEKKLVYVDFTGSDWCPPCKALHRNVLVKKEFLDYAKKNLVLVVLDFPRRTKLPAALASANKALAKKYKVRGYPTIIVMDSEGKTLHRKSGYGGQKASAYVAGLKDKLGR